MSKYANTRELRDPKALPSELRRILRNYPMLLAEAQDIIEHAADELATAQGELEIYRREDNWKVNKP